MIEKALFFFQHWKIGVHFLLRTRHFGVNNLWYSKEPSFMGQPLYRQFITLLSMRGMIRHYRLLRIRVGESVGFVPKTVYREIFK